MIMEFNNGSGSSKPVRTIGSCQQDNAYTQVHTRLGEFAEYFVGMMEDKLGAYSMLVQGEVTKHGKWSDTLSEQIGQGVGKVAGGLLGLLIGSLASGANIGGQVGKAGGKKLGGKLGEKYHQKKVNNLLDLIEFFKKHPAELRKELVEAGFDIFQSFEMQFMRVTTELGPSKAVQLLAKDAVNRAIDHMANRKGASLVEGVLLGSSKREDVCSITSGFQIKYEHYLNSRIWNTANLYDKVGLLVTQNGKTIFYKKTSEGDTGKYGYRRLLMNECFNNLKYKYERDNIAESKSVQFTGYNYILEREDFLKAVAKILGEINRKNKDPEMRKEEIINVIEEVKKDLLENVSDLKKICRGLAEDRTILEGIEIDLKSLRIEECFKEFQKHFETVKREHQVILQNLKEGFHGASEERANIAEANEKGHAITHAGMEKLESKIAKVEEIVKQKIVYNRQSIWFDAKQPVELFTGRKEELLELHKRLTENAANDRVTVITQMTSISGLGGIGKTELARKYIHRYSNYYDGNIVWINAENEASLIDSFRRLAQDKLEISLKNVDKEDRNIAVIVDMVYLRFASGKSLFIFDNAEKNDYFIRFLPRRARCPQDKMPYILVTSRIREWERGIEVLELSDLKIKDAIDFVKKGLRIPAHDESQDEEIQKLVETLQLFPLAIQQAIAYIEDQRVMEEEFSIGNYLEKYRQKQMDLLNCDLFVGIDNDYAKTTATTWNITIDTICDKQYGKLAIKILDIIAYLSPENIGRDMFLSLADGDGDILKSSVRLLVKYSMINGQKKQTLLSIHRLVQDVIRLKLKSLEKEEETLRAAMNLLKNASADHIVIVWNYASKYPKLIKDFDQELTNTYGYRTATVIHMLAENGSHEAIEQILIHASNAEECIDAVDKYKRTPLYIAAENGYVDVVELLASRGAKLDFKSTIVYASLSGRMSTGWTGFGFASNYGYTNDLVHLPDEGAKIDLSSTFIFGALETKMATGWTPLHIASFNGHLNVVEVLDSKSNELRNIRDNLGNTPLGLAVNAGHIQVVRYFSPNDDASLLQIVVQMDGVNTVKRLVEKNVDILKAKLGSETALHLAVYAGKLETVEYLVNKMKELRYELRDGIDHPGTDGCTPMSAAATIGHLKIVQLLLNEGANLYACKKDGWSALHTAAQSGRLQVVKYLIEKQKFDINFLDIKLDTALHTAAFHGRLKVVDYLLTKKADFNLIDALGATPLFLASLQNHQRIVELLLEKGANLFDTSDDKTLYGKLNFTILHTAAIYDNVELMKHLIEHKQMGKDVGKAFSVTPLHVAAIFNSSKVIAYLIDQEADVDAHVQLSNVKTVSNYVKDAIVSNGSFYGNIVQVLVNICTVVDDNLKITPNMIHKICDYPGHESLWEKQRSYLRSYLFDPCVIQFGKTILGLEIVSKHFRTLQAYVERKKN
ncbi:uncharacterized protein LOC131692068 [Topomyia yanbarensis]|uniref:uncharacterized protein LOC131692068 n=1 Tax=Topomyia yanbarensis TaxID=2498891 RepID=UPI00273BF5FC|nr:uncharacterized protein LOC131692068 [Topomyia yanbarensis]